MLFRSENILSVYRNIILSPPMLLQMAEFHSFLLNIPLSGYTTVYLAIHLLKDILVASMFWQL